MTDQTHQPQEQQLKPRSTEMRYFFLRNENKFPVACVASVYDKEMDAIKFAVSTHNPIDNFNRKRAKQIASERITAGKFLTIHNPDDVKNIKWGICYDIVAEKFPGEQIIEGRTGRHQGFKVAYLPERTREAAKLWLKEFQIDKKLDAGKEKEEKKSA
jgi:hypothetical protein